jgi:hypothetical protein
MPDEHRDSQPNFAIFNPENADEIGNENFNQSEFICLHLYYIIFSYYSIKTQKDLNDSKQFECCCDVDLIMKKTKQEPNLILSDYPPSLVPRIHCIKATRLIHNNPLLSNYMQPINLQLDQKEKEVVDDSLNFEYWNSQLNSFLIHLIHDPTLINSQNIIVNNDTQLKSKAQISLMKLRKDIIAMFEDLLLGDNLAAEYLLMHLLSHV